MTTQIERRRHPRFNIPATIIVARGQAFVGTYPAIDVSVGGALISYGPELSVGETVRIQIYMPAQEPVSCRAKVVREAVSDDRPTAWGLAFDFETVEAEERMNQGVQGVRNLVSLHQDRAVLVVDSSSEDRADIAKALHVLGRTVVFAENCDEAREALDRTSSPVDLVLLDLGVGVEGIEALIQHLKLTQPQAKRVLMSADLSASELLMLTSEAGVEEILAKPWDPRRLAELAFPQ